MPPSQPPSALGGSHSPSLTSADVPDTSLTLFVISDGDSDGDSDDRLQHNDDDDVEIVSVKDQSASLLANPEAPAARTLAKHLAEVECPICFDSVTTATVTLCGHIFCLDCIYQSVLSSSARGQARQGKGLCPLCRKNVIFKDTIVLRMRKQTAGLTDAPKLPTLKRSADIEIGGPSKR